MNYALKNIAWGSLTGGLIIQALTANWPWTFVAAAVLFSVVNILTDD